MRIPPPPAASCEQLCFFEHTEHTDNPELEGRILRDKKTGEVIVRWATQLPEEKDVINPSEMLYWLSELSCLGRIPDGSYVDVWRVADHLRDTLHANIEHQPVLSLIKADVHYALITQSEHDIREGVKSLRFPILSANTAHGEHQELLGPCATQALRLATYFPRRLTLSAFAELHLADRQARYPADSPYEHMKTFLHSLGSRAFGRFSTSDIEKGYHLLLDVLERTGDTGTLPPSLRRELACDYAGIVATERTVKPLTIPMRPMLEFAA